MGARPQTYSCKGKEDLKLDSTKGSLVIFPAKQCLQISVEEFVL
jgi:hypothetical protein